MISKSIWICLISQFLMNAATFMVMPLLAVYLTNTLSMSAFLVGTILTIYLISSRVLPIFSGPFSDKFGCKKLMVIGMLTRGVGFLGFICFSSPIMLIIMSFLIGLGMALYEPALYGIFGSQSQKNIKKTFILNNQALNLGVIIGPILGVVLLEINIQIVFLISGLIFFLLTLFLLKLDIKVKNQNSDKLIKYFSQALMNKTEV